MVWTVAMLGLMSTVMTPSSFNALMACEPGTSGGKDEVTAVTNVTTIGHSFKGAN